MHGSLGKDGAAQNGAEQKEHQPNGNESDRNHGVSVGEHPRALRVRNVRAVSNVIFRINDRRNDFGEPPRQKDERNKHQKHKDEGYHGRKFARDMKLQDTSSFILSKFWHRILTQLFCFDRLIITQPFLFVNRFLSKNNKKLRIWNKNKNYSKFGKKKKTIRGQMKKARMCGEKRRINEKKSLAHKIATSYKIENARTTVLPFWQAFN